MGHFLIKYRHSILAAVIGLTALGRSVQHTLFDDRAESVIFSDAQGYYMYLPSAFIYGNFKDFPLAAADGSLVVLDKVVPNKYTYPVALLQMPFFLIADTVAQLAPYPRDGRSLPYVLSILVAGAFYLGMAIFLLSRLLSRSFRFHIVATSLLCIFLGTNLFYYSGIEAGVSHVYSFFLFALFWFFTDGLINRHTRGRFFMLGLVFGLIVVLRPTNVVVAFLFLSWRIEAWDELRRRVLLLFPNAYALPLFVLGILLAFLPQMLFWQHAFGQWLVYSYGEEGFIYWNRPKIIQVLFDVQNGWLLYSPLMLIALWGVGVLIKKKDYFGWGLAAMLALATYAFASWWAWWFGGAFGHRCYVEYTALLSFPLALSFRQITRWNYLWKALAALCIGALLYYNLALTEIYLHSGPWDGPNWDRERFLEVLNRLV